MIVSKFNISFTILCRIIRCNFLNLTCCTKRIARAVGAFFRLEGHQFAAKAGRCWGSGGGDPAKFSGVMPFLLLEMPFCEY